MCVCVCSCSVCVFVCVCLYYIPTFNSVYACRYVYINLYAPIQKSLHTHTHTYIYIYICVHTFFFFCVIEVFMHALGLTCVGSHQLLKYDKTPFSYEHWLIQPNGQYSNLPSLLRDWLQSRWPSTGFRTPRNRPFQILHWPEIQFSSPPRFHSILEQDLRDDNAIPTSQDSLVFPLSCDQSFLEKGGDRRTHTMILTNVHISSSSNSSPDTITVIVTYRITTFLIFASINVALIEIKKERLNTKHSVFGNADF